MAKYSYITDKTHNNRKIQVESAKRDGSGKNIENNYAKQNGNYQSLTAGLSNNFDTKKVMVDESAYNFRPTATMGSVELEVGSPCKVKKIIGGSVSFNQRFYVRNTAETYGSLTLTPNTADNSFTLNGTGSGDATYMTISGVDLPIGYLANGHKYLITGVTALFSKATTLSGDTAVHIPNAGCQTNPYTGTLKADTVFAVTNNNTSVTRFYLYLHNGDSWNNAKGYINLIDLTQMFGSTIADYIYSLEQANAGSGVAWFKRYFPKEYYAYNSGELVSVKTQGKKITHFNQWDEEWELGLIDPSTGVRVQNTGGQYYRSKNYISVFPSTNYFAKLPNGFTSSVCNIAWFYYDKDKNYIGNRDNRGNVTTETPSNSYFAKFVVFFVTAQSTMPSGVNINFHYDGERDGEYEPYNSETYACDDVELRGIPQLDENNNLYFEGDEYANDGNVTRKMGQDELSDLTYTEETYGGVHYFFAKADPNYTTNLDARGIMGYCSVYGSGRDSNDLPLDGCIGFNVSYRGSGYTIAVRDDSISTRTELKNKLLGKGAVVYPLKTPTDENSIPFTEVQECDNWGTEEWLAPTTDTRPCEVPVGHETDYLPDLKAKVEVAPNTPNENGVYVMEHNASGNIYTPIATWLTDNGYVKSTDVANGYGTKDALGGTLRQLLSTNESLDFDNTAYVDLGDLNWSYGTSLGTGGKFSVFFANAKSHSTSSTNAKIVSTLYKTNNWDAVYSGADMSVALDGQTLRITNSNYTDATTFKNAMKGVLLAYEKAS